MDKVKHLKIDKSELEPAFFVSLDHLPEPPKDFNTKQSEYFYKLCNLLLEKGELNRYKTIYVQAIAKNVDQMLSTDNYFEPWEFERCGGYIKKMAQKLGYSLDQLRELEKSINRESLEAKAQLVGVSFYEMQQAGIPVFDLFKRDKKDSYGNHRQAFKNDEPPRF